MDRLSALLDGPSVWHTAERLPVASSTNDVAAGHVRNGAPPGVVVTADHQTAGRGRAGRGWEDPGGGRSLLASVTLPVPGGVPTLVPLAVGVAIGGALGRVGLPVRLKWPNDVLVHGGDHAGAKVGGILAETASGPAGSQLVVGFGIDVDWRGVDHPAGWASVAEVLGSAPDREELLVAVLRGVESWVRDLERGPGRLLDAYRAACATIGADVTVHLPGGTQLEGRAVDVADDGALVLDDGRRVLAGDVVHVRPAATARRGTGAAATSEDA